MSTKVSHSSAPHAEHTNSTKPKRKHIFNLKKEKLTHLPKRQLRAGAPLAHASDLSAKGPPIYDQEELGSCTSNSLLAVARFHDPNKSWNPSRLFHYYAERQADGDVREDAGSTISQSIAVLKKVGVCNESTWPYDQSKFAKQPPHAAYVEAANHKALQAVIVAPDAQTIKTYITQGYPINIGITVYDELESDQAASTGVVPMPGPDSQQLGGHAVWIVGYDDNKQWTDSDGTAHSGMWKLTNSWGADWGDKGHFYLPYGYLSDENLASDFWNLQKIEDIPSSMKATWHLNNKEVSHETATKAYDEHFAQQKLAVA